LNFIFGVVQLVVSTPHASQRNNPFYGRKAKLEAYDDTSSHSIVLIDNFDDPPTADQGADFLQDLSFQLSKYSMGVGIELQDLTDWCSRFDALTNAVNS
jgi:hypothetical protein